MMVGGQAKVVLSPQLLHLTVSQKVKSEEIQRKIQFEILLSLLFTLHMNVNCSATLPKIKNL
jgi:hypothetical protein